MADAVALVRKAAVRGLSFTATDTDWSAGAGPTIRGPILVCCSPSPAAQQRYPNSPVKAYRNWPRDYRHPVPANRQNLTLDWSPPILQPPELRTNFWWSPCIYTPPRGARARLKRDDSSCTSRALCRVGEVGAEQLTGGRSDVLSLETEPMAGEQGMTGQLVRLRVHYAEPQPELPSRLIAEVSAAEPGTRAAINALGHYQRESRFYADLAGRTPVHLPRCYFNHHDEATGAAVLLLEDLAPVRAGNSIAGCSVGDVRRVLVDLARLHAEWWQHSELSGMSWLQLRSLVAPEAMVAAFHRAWPSFVAKLSVPMTVDIRELGVWITENLPAR